MFFVVLGSSFIADMLNSILITETSLTTFKVKCKNYCTMFGTALIYNGTVSSNLAKIRYSRVICLFIYKEAVDSTLCQFLHFHR